MASASQVESTQGWVEFFKAQLAADADMSTPVAAIHTLIEFLRQSKAETLAELLNDLHIVVKALSSSQASKITSVSSGCELFLRFITLKADTDKDFAQCTKGLIESGLQFLRKAQQGRSRIAPKGLPFIRDGATVLTHSRSRVVAAVLIAAAKVNKRFTVYVTESRPSCSGILMAETLKEAGIPVTVIPDTAIGYVVDKVDFVIVGAEAVVESGGIINSVGTYQAAIMAKANNKPFYAVAESVKFVREFPLSQGDVPPPAHSTMPGVPSSLLTLCPLVDYTPPSYITLLFTDLGILTPSAVSDELIKLYY